MPSGILQKLAFLITANTAGLVSGANKAKGVLGGLSKSAGALGNSLQAAFAVAGIGALASKATMLAERAKGIKFAFDRINRPGFLDSLRNAVRGTVDDVELMRSAVQARNFQIPLNQLATFFRFAAERAAQTGESVQFLTNSIITGLGRGSIKIIDNLGINVQKFQQEVKKGLSFSEALAKTIREDLGTTDEDLDRITSATQRLNSQWTNLLTTLGEKVAPAADKAKNRLATALENANFVAKNTEGGFKSVTAAAGIFFASLIKGSNVIPPVFRGVTHSVEEIGEAADEAFEGKGGGVTGLNNNIKDSLKALTLLEQRIGLVVESLQESGERAQRIFEEINGDESNRDFGAAAFDRLKTSMEGVRKIGRKVTADRAVQISKQQTLNKEFEKTQAVGGAIVGVFDAIGNAAIGAQGGLASLVLGILDVIAATIKLALAQAIQSNAKKGILGLALAGVAVAGFKALFSKFVGLQQGGIVTGPTTANLAENNIPEIVLPLDQVGDFVQNVGGGSETGAGSTDGMELMATISRDKLLVWLRKGIVKNKRIGGVTSLS